MFKEFKRSLKLDHILKKFDRKNRNIVAWSGRDDKEIFGIYFEEEEVIYGNAIQLVSVDSEKINSNIVCSDKNKSDHMINMVQYLYDEGYLKYSNYRTSNLVEGDGRLMISSKGVNIQMSGGFKGRYFSTYWAPYLSLISLGIAILSLYQSFD